MSVRHIRLVVVVASVIAAGEATLPLALAQDSAGTFFRDVAGDYRRFVSRDTGHWLIVGGSGAMGIRVADEPIKNHATENFHHLRFGQEYGGPLVQIPLAIAWWTIGHAVGVDHGTVGRDLLRAQISATSWTYSTKFIVNRTRPNGEPRSFPSGHASSTFATAMVLQEHYGWKVGVPAFAAAIYTAASRVTAGKHWTSDVVVGSVVGMASARAVTLRLRSTTLTIAPVAVAGGGGVQFVARR
jgi:hypothetical protein